MGKRTPPQRYRIGVSGKQTCYLHAESQQLPSVLLLTDSRNIVCPQVVSCTSEYFTLNAISIPGGKMNHGCIELEFGKKFKQVDIVILALGTNDLASRNNHNHVPIEAECRQLVGVCQKQYPQSQVGYN